MNELARLIANLPPEKRAELLRHLEQKGRTHEARPLALPLSFAQQRLWLHHQLEPGSLAYNLPTAFRLLGRLDADALERGLQAVVARHESLRTTFRLEGDNPVQVVSPEASVRLERIDLGALPAEHRDERLHEHARGEAQRPFDLGTGPLLRASLLRMGEQEHVLLVCMHHIVTDGWSFGVLLRELLACYEALVAGKAPELPPLPLQYPQFSQWQRERLQGALLEEQLSYWREQLAGAPSALELPTSHPRPPSLSGRGGQYLFSLPGELSLAVKSFASREGSTTFMVLLAAFNVLLSRYSGQEDLCLGTPSAGREHADLERLIGFFVNTLVVRTRPMGTLTFRHFLRQVREATLGALAHQELPLQKLLEELRPPREPGRAPLFQVSFANQVAVPAPSMNVAGLEVNKLPISSESSAFELGLVMAEHPDGFSGRFDYSTDLFTPELLARMAGHLTVLLEVAVTSPDVPLARLPLLTAEERQQVLVEWNATRTEYPREASLPALFEAQVARTPDAVAVVFGDEQLTYRELDVRANQLARRLRTLGVGPEARVGLSVERSLDMVVGMLGILKAGGAYVPLDPAYPRERLAYMLEDSGARVLVTQAHLAHTLRREGMAVVCPDSEQEALACESGEPMPHLVTGDNIAYAIYTSGSTGKPKGVLVPHHTVANFFTAMDARLEAPPERVWLAVTSISFDISVLELLWTLTRGFKVVLRSEERALPSSRRDTRARKRPLDFSLFYFADDADAARGADRYRLLMEGAKFADRNGFTAVWTPERHFHAFGGLYPSPAIAAAAVAAVTERVGIRAGSVVMPLHHPVRVAEEWALVDNLSRGRVGVSLASGWHANDFVFNPSGFERRKELMLEGLEVVRKLWRGETVRYEGGAGTQVDVKLRPQPVQTELPVWLTAAGNPETFKEAGRLGTRLLTHLLGQSLEELEQKLALYREAWKAAGHPGEGYVTLMLHTYVDTDSTRVRQLVDGPFRGYLKSSLDLMRLQGKRMGIDMSSESFTSEDMDRIVANAFERYFETSGLFGTPREVREKVGYLKELGVDEVGCLVDFGIDAEAVLRSLPALAEVKQRSDRDSRLGGGSPPLPEQLRKHSVTHLQCTPSFARALLMDPESAEALGGLRQLLVGGEALPTDLARQLQEKVPSLLNMYGPTETTIWSSTHAVRETEGPIPLGSPLANTELYVLDTNLEPVPIGVAGELYIGGEGVVRGYLGRPALTAERFVPDAFSGRSGARLYRTGDVARWRPTGLLEFIGRADHQVKLRGFRIELGEIEAVLARQPAVRETVVVVREDVPDDKRLVGYVVPRPEQAPEVAALLQAVREKLPEYMVPSTLVVLEALPLTPNGKVDRKALPAPEGRVTTQEYVAPRDELEQQVASIWAELLRVEKVGVQDNFFHLGGHSLLAAQVVARVRDQFAVELPLHELFEKPTVENIARHVVQAQAQQVDPEELARMLAELQATGTEGQG